MRFAPNVIVAGQQLHVPLGAAGMVLAVTPPAIASLVKAADTAIRAITPTPAPAAAPAPTKTPAPTAAPAVEPVAYTVKLGVAARAVTAALDQQGTPYVYGGSAPGGFDCSGLVQWIYKKVGIALPRTAAAQATVGHPVSLSQLQPGDLLFFYQPVGHVAIYVGNGKIAEASQPGSKAPGGRTPWRKGQTLIEAKWKSRMSHTGTARPCGPRRESKLRTCS